MPQLIEDEQIIIITPGGGSGGASSGTDVISTDPVLSSEVGDVEFVISSDSAKIEISNDANVIIFSSAPSALNGKCRAYDVSDIISEDLKARGLSFGQYKIAEKVSKSSITKKVLLSDRVISGGYAAASRFPLISAGIGVLPSFGKGSVYTIPQNLSGVRFLVSVVGYDMDGERQNGSFYVNPSRIVDDAIAVFDFVPEDLVRYANENCHFQFEFDRASSIRVQSVSGTQYISATFYVIDDPDMLEFRFRNNFGLFEYIYMHAEAVPELKDDAQLAYLGNRVLQYDVEHSQYFSVQVSNLSASEWQRISQFISSREIYDAYGRQILLSDVSTEMCKSYDGLGSFKFSYRFADSRLIAE